MNKKIALVSLALFTAFAGAAATLHAGTDVHINIGLGGIGPRRLPPPVVVIDRPERPRGHWKVVTVREWIPARWSVEPGRHGRPVRRFEPGHYSYREERVWVGYDSDRDWDRGGRGWDNPGRR
jgi:hypothetical protein